MMRIFAAGFRQRLKMIFAFVLVASSGGGNAWALSSPWVAGHKTQARLIAGRTGPEDGGRVMAFVEIALEPGWKTYWRTPGDAGGLPPSFDWSNSQNLDITTEVLYPAPHRFTDKSGSTIGYDTHVVFPIVINAANATAPIELAIDLQYGICKEICVPVEALLQLEIPPGVTALAPEAALDGLSHVPRPQDKLAAGDPVLVKAEGTLEGAAPKLTISARFAGDGEGADAFVEAPGGAYLPMLEPKGKAADGTLIFEAPLGADVDLAAIKGQPLTVTLVSASGASVGTFTVK
jgi:DsbC/DsbD-like thiol-disulfide interchange protein